ncbi:MAG: UDP-3-O-[3-hydroxymyristoyl] N-acetylglucosamine deacetylase [Pirellulales bacterium]|nr:UDP-3-O-[3-hydroxymyristoyl] N-acetylglucosamine deacetylase [Pirellulales bacterium]
MDTTHSQCTIAAPVAVEGFGYWSGRDVRVEFRPADVDTGLVFVRGDLPGEPAIPARFEYRVDTPLRTSLESGGAAVEMVEHVLATLGGLGVDNCRIWVDQPEMPGCDGSCLPFVQAIDSVGLRRQDKPCPRMTIQTVTRIRRGACSLEAGPSPDGRTWLEYHLDYPGTAIGRQSLCVALSPQVFRRGLAPSRTFLLVEQAEQLKAQGLGRRARFADLLVFGPDGPIDNLLRFPDECVRHKLLDMVGDLTLAGWPLVGRFVASRSGHQLNAQLVKLLVDKARTMEACRRCA